MYQKISTYKNPPFFKDKEKKKTESLRFKMFLVFLEEKTSGVMNTQVCNTTFNLAEY